MKATKKTLKAMLLLSMIICMYSGNLAAQEQFRLSDYKNPDYRWQALDLGFGLGGNNSFYRQEIESGITQKNYFNRFQGDLNVVYYKTKNSEFYQGYMDFGLLGNIWSDWINEKNVTDDMREEQKTINQDINLSAHTVNRFYDKRKRFVEVNLNLGGGVYNSLEKYSADPEEFPYLNKRADYQYQVSASLPLLIGKGRIEEVQDARLAVYILDDLTKSGDLKRTPTPEEILAFAQFITQTKNQRFFDSRIRKIAEITAIDSFLTVLDLKAQSDASYYTLLNDNWDNANGPVRRTGSRFSIGLVPDIDLVFSGSELFYRDTINNPDIIENFTHKSDNQIDSWGLDAVTGYIWEKPANLYWQHTVSTNLSYSLYNEQGISRIYDRDSLTYEQKSCLNSPNLKFDLGYTIGYFPNSRTNIRLGINSSFNQYWGDEKIDDDPKKDVGKTFVDSYLNLSCYYYISPQVRFSFYISSMYSFTKINQELPDDVYGDKTRHNFQNRIGASLTYSIF